MSQIVSIILVFSFSFGYGSSATNWETSLYQVYSLEEDLWSQYIFGNAPHATTAIGCAGYCNSNNNCDLFHVDQGSDITERICLIGNSTANATFTFMTNPQPNLKDIYQLTGSDPINPCVSCIFPIRVSGRLEHDCIVDPNGSGRNICYTEVIGNANDPVTGSEIFCPAAGCDLTKSYERVCEKCVFPWTAQSGAGPFSDCSNPDGSLGDWCATEVNVNGVYVTGTYVYCPARGCSQYLP